MAKNVKAIKCPQCGSVDKEALGDDRFLCQNCGTEYYLDDDYTHIVHHLDTTAHSTPDTLESTKSKTSLKTILILTGVVTLLITLVNILPSKRNSDGSLLSSDFLEEELLLTKNKKDQIIPVMVGIQKAENSGTNANTVVVKFYDEDFKLTKEQSLKVKFSKSSGFLLETSYMTNGDAYILCGEKVLLRIDPDHLKLQEFESEYYSAYPELASGIAQIETKNNQDAFKILAQNGSSYLLLPILQKLISTEQEVQVERMQVPNAPPVTFYTFCDKNVGKLVSYVQKFETGHLRDIPYFDCDEEEIASSDPKLRFKSTNLVSYQTLTDRIFYNATILGYDDQRLIVSTTLDAADESSPKIQALTTQTGEVVWTYELGAEIQTALRPHRAVINKNKTIVCSKHDFLSLDNQTGREISRLK